LIKWLVTALCFLLGLPNTFGEYDETPEYTGQMLQVLIDSNSDNIVQKAVQLLLHRSHVFTVGDLAPPETTLKKLHWLNKNQKQ